MRDQAEPIGAEGAVVDIKSERTAFQTWWRMWCPDREMPSFTSHIFDAWLARARTPDPKAAGVERGDRGPTLYREIDALGGTGVPSEGESWSRGHSEALTDVLTILERRGFTETSDATALRAVDAASGGGDGTKLLALRAIKAVTATTKDAAAGLGRIMSIARQAGVPEPYNDLMADENIRLIVTAGRPEWQHLFAAAPATAAPAPNVQALVEALREIFLEASETIPPDGKDAAFAALERIMFLTRMLLAAIQAPAGEAVAPPAGDRGQR